MTHGHKSPTPHHLQKKPTSAPSPPRTPAPARRTCASTPPVPAAPPPPPAPAPPRAPSPSPAAPAPPCAGAAPCLSMGCVCDVLRLSLSVGAFHSRRRMILPSPHPPHRHAPNHTRPPTNNAPQLRQLLLELLVAPLQRPNGPRLLPQLPQQPLGGPPPVAALQRHHAAAEASVPRAGQGHPDPGLEEQRLLLRPQREGLCARVPAAVGALERQHGPPEAPVAAGGVLGPVAWAGGWMLRWMLWCVRQARPPYTYTYTYTHSMHAYTRTATPSAPAPPRALLGSAPRAGGPACPGRRAAAGGSRP